MFIGQYSVIVDAKGRIAVPAPLRKNLRGRVFLWRKGRKFELHKEIKSISPKDAPNIVEIHIDKQGRIQVPEVQREQAGLDHGQVMTVLGRATYIEFMREKRG